MATDIVIQLRELAASMKRGEGMSTVYGAANEIERLRELISHAYQSSFVYECNYSFNTDKEPCQDCIDIEDGKYD